MKEREIERLNKLKEYEKKLYDKGIKYIAGIDEAGRGPLAGPVVVGCVIMPQDSFIEYVNDSKKVSETKREMLYEKITNEAIAWSTGIVMQDEIDEINILNATKKALTMAIDNLKVKPEVILVDALEKIDTHQIPYISVIKGYNSNRTRKRLMEELRNEPDPDKKAKIAEKIKMVKIGS